MVTLVPPFGAFVYIAVGRPRAIREVEEAEDQEVDVEEEQEEPLMK